MIAKCIICQFPINIQDDNPNYQLTECDEYEMDERHATHIAHFISMFNVLNIVFNAHERLQPMKFVLELLLKLILKNYFLFCSLLLHLPIF